MMSYDLSIKRRVSMTVIGLAIASIVAIGLFTYLTQTHQVRAGLQDLATSQSRLFETIIASDAEGLARAQSGYSRLETLLRPFAAGTRDELLAAAQPLFTEIRKDNNITHMYFIRPDGTVLLRVHKPEQGGDKLTRTTFLKAVQTKQPSSGLEMGKNFFSLRSVQPVSLQGKPIGFLEVAQEIDHVFKQMKAINGNDVSLFLSEEFIAGKGAEVKTEKVGNFRILYPTSKDTTLKLAAELSTEMQAALKVPSVTVVSAGGARYAVGLAPVKDAAGVPVGLLFTQKDVSSLYSGLMQGILTNLIVLGAIVAASAALLYLSMRKSLALFESLQRHIVRVTTSWDLSRRLKVETKDEIGCMAADFNLMTDKLADMVAHVKNSGRELGDVSSDINQASRQIRSAAEQQASSIMETSTAITQINASIQQVNHGVDSLSLSAAESSSSMLEMAASVEEVALNTESLAQSVEEVGSSILEMTASIKQVGENAGNLMEAANITSSSIMEMDSSMKQVEQTAATTVAVSEAVRQDAETGKQSVEATIAGINAIRQSSHITSEVISTLSERARDIGAILSVIDDVAAQTNLLALNAAIIAAQAGEHGKGFAVVAEEIKGLAQRTSSSTREIADVIQGVQDETRRAVEAIAKAESSIAEGEALSRKSGDALNKIVAGAQAATDQVNSIARATMEQARGSQMIRAAMEQVTDMVGLIASATREQGQGTEQIMTAVEQMKKVTSHVRNATREQSSVGSFIARATENITDMIGQIKCACDEQSRGSRQVLPAVERINASAEGNIEAVRMLGATLETLAEQINILNNEIGRFTTEESGNPAPPSDTGHRLAVHEV